MNGKWTCGALLAIALFGASRFVGAFEPQPATEKAATDQPAPTAEQPAAEPLPPPEADKPDATIKPMPQPKRPEALQGNKPVSKEAQPPVDKAKKEKKSLVSPAGLLSRAPIVVPYSTPGLGKLNLNASSTTIEQIQRLPGVGFTWAPRILAGRPYRTFGEMARDGIPFTTIDALSREVELGP